MHRNKFEKKPETGDNSYIALLKGLIGKTVCVYDSDGRDHEGVLEAVNFSHLNAILRTNGKIKVLKNIKWIEET